MITQLVAKRAGVPMGSTYLNGMAVDQFINTQWKTAPGPTVIKAHGVGPATLSALRAGKIKAVCTFRDPRDCVASDLSFLRSDFESTVQRTIANLQFLTHYRTTNTLFVKYEEMTADPLKHVKRIAEYLDAKLTDVELSEIDRSTGVEASKQVCNDLKRRPAGQFLFVEKHRVDPTTHLHENHIQSGRAGRWRDELTIDEAVRLTHLFRPWLAQLGYDADLPTAPAVTPQGTIAFA